MPEGAPDAGGGGGGPPAAPAAGGAGAPTATPPASSSAPGAAPAAPGAAPGAGAPAAAAAKPDDGNLGKVAAEYRKLQKRVKELEATEPEIKRLRELDSKLKDPKGKISAIAELLGDDGYAELIAHRLKAAGHEVDDKPVDPALQKALDRIAELEGKHKSAEEEKQTLQQQQQARAALDEARKLVQGGGEAYAFTGALGYEHAIVAEYKRLLDEGEAPDEAAVAASVEVAVETTITQQLSGLLKSAKGKALLRKLLTEADPSAASPPATGTPANGRQQVPPVNNSHSAARQGDADTTRLSRQQKQERALAKVRERAAS